MSWSLLEAMGCGCAVVVSDTAPVREVVRHGQNGLLLDFFWPTDLPRRWWSCSKILSVLLALERPHVRASGTYELNDCFTRQLALMDLVASRSIVA